MTSDPINVAWRVNAERVLLLGWSRAILMQLAHPLVAAGVAEHSTFRGGPLAAVSRLHHTVRAMLSLTFGDAEARAATLEVIRGIHRRVHGRLPQTVGPFAAGTPYSAEDPALLLWVHVTLVESMLLIYERVVTPLSPAERDAYCAEGASIAIALGARDDEVPRTWEALRSSIDATLASGALAVGAQARELANAVLTPPIAFAVWPAARINRLITIGLLPSPVRADYGFASDARAARRLERAWRLLRAARALTPITLAYWPDARRPRHRTPLPTGPR
jgi:uncharacterized protein (DUF2236 family)